MNCSTVGQAKLYLKVYSTFATLALVAYVISVALIVQSRAYRQFIHRLTLYLAVVGLLRTLHLWLEIAPVDLTSPDNSSVTIRRGWSSVCVVSAMVVQYVGFAQTLVVIWICFYIFMLVVYQRQLKQRKHEAAGIATAVLVPLIFVWEPLVTDSYGLSGTRCWIKDKCHDRDSDVSFALGLAIHTVPYFLMSLLGVVFLGVSIAWLVRKISQTFLRHQHWLAVKEILPLIFFPLFYSLLYLGRAIAEGIYRTKGTYDASLDGVVVVSLVHACALTVPLSLVSQSGVRVKLCVGCRRQKGRSVSSVTIASLPPIEAQHWKTSDRSLSLTPLPCTIHYSLICAFLGPSSLPSFLHFL
eukprot:Em0804g6a